MLLSSASGRILRGLELAMALSNHQNEPNDYEKYGFSPFFFIFISPMKQEFIFSCFLLFQDFPTMFADQCVTIQQRLVTQIGACLLKLNQKLERFRTEQKRRKVQCFKGRIGSFTLIIFGTVFQGKHTALSRCRLLSLLL